MHGGMLRVCVWRAWMWYMIYQFVLPLFLELFDKIIYRHEQDSNLWGKIPLDFESNALTTRPSWLHICSQLLQEIIARATFFQKMELPSLSFPQSRPNFKIEFCSYLLQDRLQAQEGRTKLTPPFQMYATCQVLGATVILPRVQPPN